jgi:hypothetical protein
MTLDVFCLFVSVCFTFVLLIVFCFLCCAVSVIAQMALDFAVDK